MRSASDFMVRRPLACNSAKMRSSIESIWLTWAPHLLRNNRQLTGICLRAKHDPAAGRNAKRESAVSLSVGLFQRKIGHRAQIAVRNTLVIVLPRGATGHQFGANVQFRHPGCDNTADLASHRGTIRGATPGRSSNGASIQWLENRVPSSPPSVFWQELVERRVFESWTRGRTTPIVRRTCPVRRTPA